MVSSALLLFGLLASFQFVIGEDDANPTYIGTIEGQKVYVSSKDQYTFNEASLYCLNLKGRLFEPKTKVINDYIKDALIKNGYKSRNSAWIGGSRYGFHFKLDNFYWISDKTMFVSRGFQDFQPGEPNNAGDELCVQMRNGYDYRWNDLHCSKRMFALCGVPEQKTMIGSLNGLSYHISQERYTYEEAIAFCKRNYGDLVEPSTVEVNDLIKLYLLDNDRDDNPFSSWVGADRRGLPAGVSNYKWRSNKTQVTSTGFSDWQAGKPGSKLANECIQFRSQADFKWSDLDCSAKQYAICQYSHSVSMGTLDDTEYRISQEKYSFDDAVNYCFAKGGYIAEPRTKEINDFVKTYLIQNDYAHKGNVFMGGTKRGNNAPEPNSFYWLSDVAKVGASPDTFTDWYQNRPNNVEGAKYYMEFRGENFQWNDVDDAKNFVICAFDKTVLKISDDKMDFDFAYTYCNSLGLTLYEPRTKILNDRAKNFLLKYEYKSKGGAWFGLTRRGYKFDAKNFYWLSDRTKLPITGFSDWDQNEPDGSGGKEECVQYRPDNDIRWNDLNCDNQQYALCGATQTPAP